MKSLARGNGSRRAETVARRLLFVLWGAAIVVGTARFASASAAVTVSGPSTHEFLVDAGVRRAGYVTLHNVGDEPATVRLFVGDYVFGPEGGTVRDGVGIHARSAAPWIALGDEVVVIGPREDATVAYEIVVPPDLDLRGTFWALLMAESTSAPVIPSFDPEVGSTPSAAVHVRTAVRYAVQVVVHVGDEGGPAPRVEGALLSGDGSDGRWLFAVDVANDGDRWFVPEVWLELYRPDGRFVGEFPGAGRRVFPGARERQTVALPANLAGAYLAVLLMDGGGGDVFAARFDLDIPAGR